jgi:hypothetical protein
MSDRPPELARMPSWGDNTPPWPGSWCRACHGTRWWTERRASMLALAVMLWWPLTAPLFPLDALNRVVW